MLWSECVGRAVALDQVTSIDLMLLFRTKQLLNKICGGSTTSWLVWDPVKQTVTPWRAEDQVFIAMPLGTACHKQGGCSAQKGRSRIRGTFVAGLMVHQECHSGQWRAIDITMEVLVSSLAVPGTFACATPLESSIISFASSIAGVSPATTPTLDSHVGMSPSPFLPCTGAEVLLVSGLKRQGHITLVSLVLHHNWNAWLQWLDWNSLIFHPLFFSMFIFWRLSTPFHLCTRHKPLTEFAATRWPWCCSWPGDLTNSWKTDLSKALCHIMEPPCSDAVYLRILEDKREDCCLVALLEPSRNI